MMIMIMMSMATTAPSEFPTAAERNKKVIDGERERECV